MLTIGSKLYGYNPHFPRNYTETTIIGQTEVSWIIGTKEQYNKVNKRTLRDAKTEQYYAKSVKEMKEILSITDQTSEIAEKVNACKDYKKLKAIEEILEQ